MNVLCPICGFANRVAGYYRERRHRAEGDRRTQLYCSDCGGQFAPPVDDVVNLNVEASCGSEQPER